MPPRSVSATTTTSPSISPYIDDVTIAVIVDPAPFPDLDVLTDALQLQLRKGTGRAVRRWLLASLGS